MLCIQLLHAFRDSNSGLHAWWQPSPWLLIACFSTANRQDLNVPNTTTPPVSTTSSVCVITLLWRVCCIRVLTDQPGADRRPDKTWTSAALAGLWPKTLCGPLTSLLKERLSQQVPDGPNAVSGSSGAECHRMGGPGLVSLPSQLPWSSGSSRINVQHSGCSNARLPPQTAQPGTPSMPSNGIQPSDCVHEETVLTTSHSERRSRLSLLTADGMGGGKLRQEGASASLKMRNPS